MTRPALLLAGLVVLAAFAGCAGRPGDDGGGDGGDASSSSSGAGDPASGSTRTSASSLSRSGSGSPSGGTGPNGAPSAVLEAANPAGAAPLVVNFTINGTDPDGDPLTWTLDFDGDGAADLNGTNLPAEANHTFDAGAYVVNLTVSDGVHSANASINVTASIGAAASPPIQVVDGDYVVGVEGCAAAGYDAAGSDGGAPAGGATNEVTRIQFEVEPLTIGRPFFAIFAFDQGYLYVAVDFYDADDGLLDGSQNTGQSPNFGGLEVTGTVPAGAVKAVLFACGGPTSASVHYEA